MIGEEFSGLLRWRPHQLPGELLDARLVREVSGDASNRAHFIVRGY